MKRLFKKCKANALKMSKIFLVLVIFATEVLSPMVVMVNAKELPKMEKGDVYNPLTNTASDSASVTIGQLINEGDVSVVKTVKKTDVLGRYEVSFEVKGKNTVTNTPITKPLYVVIVLDRSGSMVCDDTKDGYSYVVNKNAHYVAADGVGIACLDSYEKRNPSALIKDKWESAIDGAIEFSDSLVEKANTYVSLVTFSGTATEATDFRSNSDVVENQSIFAKSEFGHPQGSTNLKDAIAKAYKKLNTITTTDAQKYIVVIGDGEPTEGGDYFCNYNHTCSAKKQSTIAKNKGINIYSIGYGVDKNATAQEVLKYISSNTLVTSQNPTGYEIGTYTDNGYYLEATTSGIVNSFETIFDNINVSLAGTNASLKDNLGGKFTFTISDSNVTDNGRSYTYNIGDIKEEGTKFSFFIDIDQDSPTGLYDTNDGFTLSYTDANGISKELPCGTNPQVYWEQNTYPYEIRYYKDEITNVNDATTYLGNVKGQAAHNANINVSLTKYIPEGYVSLATNPTSLTVDKTKENIVDVLYVKRSDLSYTVRYYKDSVSENNKLGNDVVVGNQTFGSQVEASEINVNKEKPTGYQDGVIETEMPITITTGENVINVVYSKDTFSYTVKYFYEKVGYTTEEERFVENEELRSSYEALYGDEITTYEAQNKTGFSFYKVNPIKLVVSENEQANVINVYYVRNNYNFTIKHLYENLNGEYTENEDYRIEDETSFGSSINSEEQEKHEDDGYIFGNVDPENMIIDTENNEMNFYYDLRDDLSYTVRYYKDSVSESNKLGNDVVVGNQTFGAIVELNSIDKDLRKPYGYTNGVIQNSSDLIIGLEENYIDVVYTKNPGEITSEYFSKSGDEVIADINGVVEYNIKYKAVISDYVGEVTLTIVDTLPYEIDLSKSIIGNGTYNNEDKTITYTLVKDIKENDTILLFEQSIKVVYKNINSDIVTNNVKSHIEFGSLKSDSESEFTSEVAKGSVIVKYVDTLGNELAESLELIDFVGSNYETTALEFSNYYLFESPVNATGIYTEEVIYVTYVYDENGVGDDIEPPHTGVDTDYNNVYFSILLLGMLTLIRKFAK